MSGDCAGSVNDGGKAGHAAGHVGGMHDDGRKARSNLGGDAGRKAQGELQHVETQHGASDLANQNVLRPLEPIGDLIVQPDSLGFVQTQQEISKHTAALRVRSLLDPHQDLSSTRSFKYVQKIARGPIQPLWPSDTNDAMRPIVKPDSTVIPPPSRLLRRGFRPKTGQLVVHSDGSHRAFLRTPGGKYINELVLLNGVDSAIMRRSWSKDETTSYSVSTDGSVEGDQLGLSPGKGTLVQAANLGLTMHRSGDVQRNRKHSLGHRLGDGDGQFRDMRIIKEEAIGSGGGLLPLQAALSELSKLQTQGWRRSHAAAGETCRPSLPAGDKTLVSESLFPRGSSLPRGRKSTEW